MIWDDLDIKPKPKKKAKPDINSDELLYRIRWKDGYGYHAYMYVKPIIDEMLGKSKVENEQ